MTTEIPAVVFSGPFRATKLWNDVIRNFRSEMPVRKHRRHIRNYDNSFTANEAVNFLHDHLKRDPNFGPTVTRTQTIQLLRKFLKSAVFERIRGCKSPSSSEDFKDNGELYRFTHVIYSPNRVPLSQRSNVESQLGKGPSTPTVGHNKPSVVECEVAWKDAVLRRLHELLLLKDLKGIIDPRMVSGRNVMHNATKTDGRGVVVVPDRADDLPHWILSAMKCLANWPNARGSGSCLPNYHGFEQDVFRVVRDYFGNLEEPLTTFNMYQTLVGILIRAEYLDVSGVCASTPEIHQFESVENLMLGMASRVWLEASQDPPQGPQGPGRFETAFTSESPVTRIIVPQSQSNGNLKRSHSRPLSAIVGSDMERLRNRSGGYVNPCCPWEDMDSESSFHTAPSHASSRSLETLDVSMTGAGNQFASRGKDCALKSFAICFLMLTPGMRKKLHLLLRLMSKIAANNRLTLDDTKSNRNLVLETFTRCVLRSFREVDYDELVAPRLVAFLMDHHEAIFETPDGLSSLVETILAQPGRCKSRQRQHSLCISKVPAYCEQVTSAEYERQKATVARGALADLLRGIVDDPRLNGREKTKKLKQFKRMYPEIYENHFPGSSENTRPQLPQNAKKSLLLLKSVRL